MGANTLLLTHSIETLGAMSCNPAIGGIGKGHLVREIDALGGAMARATDRAGIQFRTLNAEQGPGGARDACAGRPALYRQAIRRVLETQPNLTLFQQEVADLRLSRRARHRASLRRPGIEFEARAVVLTVGTFLAGKHSRRAGELQRRARGRSAFDRDWLRACANCRSALGGSRPARRRASMARTVDYSVMAEQHSDDPQPVFSFLGRRSEHPRQVPCHITATNERTHEIIRRASDRSPMFTGRIEGIRPALLPVG